MSFKEFPKGTYIFVTCPYRDFLKPLLNHKYCFIAMAFAEGRRLVR